MSVATQAGRRLVASACPSCANPRHAAFAGDTDRGREWVRCDCGLVYKRSEPAGDADAQFLGDAPEGDAHYDAAYFERYARRRRRRIAKSRRQILDTLEAAPRGRLLDVGCSLGYALEAARSLGLEAAGVDLSPHAIEHCRRLGFEAHRGTLDELPFEDASFSLLLLKHVFEHTPEPRRALAELRRVLAPGGGVFFAVPNLEYRRGGGAPATSRFFRGEAGRAHFVCYSPATLTALVESEGFRVHAVHPQLLHRRAGAARLLLDLALAPLKLPLRAAAEALALRKEFWLVAVRS